MDRFIDPLEQLEFFKNSILKSNMDRFIEKEFCKTDFIFDFLKSNMDRFIVLLLKNFAFTVGFKIQYG